MKTFDKAFPGFIPASPFIDALDQPFLDGFMNRHAVDRPAHAIAAILVVFDNLIEESAAAAMGGNDGELASPHGDWLGDMEKLPLILMQGEFIQFDVPTFAGESIRI